MMQAWADYLDRLRDGKIKPGPHKVPGLARNPAPVGYVSSEFGRPT